MRGKVTQLVPREPVAEEPYRPDPWYDDLTQRNRATEVIRANLARCTAAVEECIQEMRWRPDVCAKLEEFAAKVNELVEAAL